jgi:hypothetical protein
MPHSFRGHAERRLKRKLLEHDQRRTKREHHVDDGRGSGVASHRIANLGSRVILSRRYVPSPG